MHPLRWFLTGGGKKPFHWFDQSPWRKLLFAVMMFFVVMGTLNVSFHIALDRWREAERDMDRATDYLLHGQHELALESFDEVIAFSHRRRDALAGKALVLIYMKRYDESLATFDRLIHLDDDNAHAWQGRGMCMEFLGRYPEAIEAYGRALELEPGFTSVSTQLAHVKELAKLDQAAPAP